MNADRNSGLADFSGLTPDLAIHLVEQAMGVRCSNLCRPLNSYINRVYEVQLDEGGFVVAKFYRPGRWSPAALQDEQDFLLELAEAELPVIAPLRNAAGATLHRHDGLHFSVFPKKGGRPLDELGELQWKEFGRLMGRVHNIGAHRRPRDRVFIHPARSTQTHLRDILAIDFPYPGLRREYEDTVRELVARVTPLFDDIDTLRIHGDCHAANLILRPGESIFLIDFDDMATGPAVQDLWMLLPAHLRESRRELDWLLDGYEMFRELDRRELRLIEPLRAMRFIHFTAWCAHQKADGGFARLSPDWGTAAYWKREIQDLQRQMQEIADSEAERC